MRAWKLLFTCIMFYFPIVFAQQAVEGSWITVDEKTGEKGAVIEFAFKDGLLNGTIVNTYPQPGDTGICSKCPGDFKDKPILGLQIAWGLREKGSGEWDGGQILDARTGKIYHLKIAVKGNKLYVRGYVGISLLGRTQVWERA